MSYALLSREGRVLVDRKKYPTLHRSLEAGAAKVRAERQKWAHVLELRGRGKRATAERVAKRLLGIKGPPMSEEKKAELRRWKEEHREEIKERRQQKAAFKKRVQQLARAPRRKHRPHRAVAGARRR